MRRYKEGGGASEAKILLLKSVFHFTFSEPLLQYNRYGLINKQFYYVHVLFIYETNIQLYLLSIFLQDLAPYRDTFLILCF